MARVIIALGAACPVPVGRESGRPGRARAYAGTDGIERELVVNHALGYDVQQVYLVTLAAKLAQGPVDHHLAVRRAVDREQDLAQRRGMLGLVRGGHLGLGLGRARCQPADGTFRELREPFFGGPERWGPPKKAFVVDGTRTHDDGHGHLRGLVGHACACCVGPRLARGSGHGAR